MMRRLQFVVAVLLVFSVIGVSGFASAQSITHESHHSHHQKATHGTVLCSWMCAAGLAVGTDPLAVSSSLLDVGAAPIQQELLRPSESFSPLHPRAPPQFFL